MEDAILTKEDDEQQYIDRYVAFMDIMGFGDLVQRADEDVKWRMFLRDVVRDLANTLPATSHAGFRASQFSDCIVVSIPKTAKSLFTILHSSALLAVRLFDRGRILRGGISVGKLWHTEETLFGPALVDAAKFDSSGGMPRIALHPNLMLEIQVSPVAEINKWYRPDPHDASQQILHTFHEFEYYGLEEGARVLGKNADLYAQGISFSAESADVTDRVREKWRWVRDYWNRSVDVHGILARAE